MIEFETDRERDKERTKADSAKNGKTGFRESGENHLNRERLQPGVLQKNNNRKISLGTRKQWGKINRVMHN